MTKRKMLAILHLLLSLCMGTAVTLAQPSPVKTLILMHETRLRNVAGWTADEVASLMDELMNEKDGLQYHPLVNGVVLDVGEMGLASLYDAWDAVPTDPEAANAVLFGCHDCSPAVPGLRDLLRELIDTAYPDVCYLLVIGDHRIIPMAWLPDETRLLPESSYQDLDPSSDLYKLLQQNVYLSDDALSELSTPMNGDLGILAGTTFLGRWAVGRLVETSAEVLTAINTFKAQDGHIDLTGLDRMTAPHVQVYGYDKFLTDTARRIAALWREALDIAPGTLSVDDTLIGNAWPGSDPAQELKARLYNVGSPFPIVSANEHATHFSLGVPASGFSHEIFPGLDTLDLRGQDACGHVSSCPTPPPFRVGGMVYSVGCHGGLSVPGSCFGSSPTLDLPQTLLGLETLAFLANSGYGWGLKSGLGFSERLVFHFTEELTRGGSPSVGELVLKAKERFFFESLRFNAFSRKVLMEWTLYGFPMAEIHTGIAPPAARGARRATATCPGTSTETIEGVQVQWHCAPSPEGPVVAEVSFDFTGGTFTKYDGEGKAVPGSGCPVAGGCYYALNGQAVGVNDLPIVPSFPLDSTLTGYEQRGVLWRGGAYSAGEAWRAIFGEPVSNRIDTSYLLDLQPLPRKVVLESKEIHRVRTSNVRFGRSASRAQNKSSVVVPVGYVQRSVGSMVYDVHVRFDSMAVDVLYVPAPVDPIKVSPLLMVEDREGPVFGGVMHTVTGNSVRWDVMVTDDLSAVWKVLVVYSDNASGRWLPLELTENGGHWEGAITAPASGLLTYIVQAVDVRGNAAWYMKQFLPSASYPGPTSEVPLFLPQVVDIDLLASERIFADGFESGDTSAWESSTP